MSLGKKKIIGMCVGVFVLGVVIGALTLFGFSKFNEGTKSAENSTKQVSEANQGESKEEQKVDKKASEDNNKTKDSENKNDSKINGDEVILVREDNGYTYMTILTFNGDKLLRDVLEVRSPEGKSFDSIKKEYEAANYKILEHNKDVLKMESSKFTVDSLNKVGGKRDIINFILYD